MNFQKLLLLFIFFSVKVSNAFSKILFVTTHIIFFCFWYANTFYLKGFWFILFFNLLLLPLVTNGEWKPLKIFFCNAAHLFKSSRSFFEINEYLLPEFSSSRLISNLCRVIQRISGIEPLREFGVFYGSLFPVFGVNMEIYRINFRVRLRINPNLGGEGGGDFTPPVGFSLITQKRKKAVTLEFCSIQ